MGFICWRSGGEESGNLEWPHPRIENESRDVQLDMEAGELERQPEELRDVDNLKGGGL